MDRRIIYFSLLTLSLTACSGVETRKQAKGNFDYVNIQANEELKVPSDLTAPPKHDKYSIPDVKGNDNPVGKKVDIRAPALVLPLASGSRIDEFDKSAEIWYDKVDDNRDLREQVIKAISDYLASESVEFSSSDADNNVWESDWFHVEKESGHLFWKSVDLTESWRFRYSLVTKPHGRSIGLNVELIDYMFTSGKGSTKKIDPIEQQRVEMGMINAVTSQLDYHYRLNNKEDRIARANMQIVTLGQSVKEEPAYIIDYPIDELWSYLPGFFEKYNFVVTDLNEEKYFYEVEYTRTEPSLWDSIWGDDVPVILLESGSYQFHLQTTGEKTSLVIKDAQQQIITKELLDKNFEVLEPALSFR
ncbi:outer membrane protein assembly factor BamC [Thalassotalea sp. ND16A]|uniref:outer membrane protein assembly factor BamC n=1 Tax=Thalassotalea sp. ND16A TaxID=1535422 RepID=UPI00051A0441|nr:outer membrane protein assembly factor BamC [Thalassotalea sp. ND16A]KGJ88716.1 hypothetical protein ND16A_2418 [Thalassotalea sp. ND16A]